MKVLELSIVFLLLVMSVILILFVSSFSWFNEFTLNTSSLVIILVTDKKGLPGLFKVQFWVTCSIFSSCFIINGFICILLVLLLFSSFFCSFIISLMKFSFSLVKSKAITLFLFSVLLLCLLSLFCSSFLSLVLLSSVFKLLFTFYNIIITIKTEIKILFFTLIIIYHTKINFFFFNYHLIYFHETE